MKTTFIQLNSLIDQLEIYFENWNPWGPQGGKHSINDYTHTFMLESQKNGGLETWMSPISSSSSSLYLRELGE